MFANRTRVVASGAAVMLLLLAWASGIALLTTPDAVATAPRTLRPAGVSGQMDLQLLIETIEADPLAAEHFSSELSLQIGGGQTIEEPGMFDRFCQWVAATWHRIRTPGSHSGRDEPPEAFFGSWR